MQPRCWSPISLLRPFTTTYRRQGSTNMRYVQTFHPHNPRNITLVFLVVREWARLKWMATVADRQTSPESHRTRNNCTPSTMIWLNTCTIRGIKWHRRRTEMGAAVRRRFIWTSHRIRNWKTLNRLIWRRIGQGKLCVIYNNNNNNSNNRSIHSRAMWCDISGFLYFFKIMIILLLLFVILVRGSFFLQFLVLQYLVLWVFFWHSPVFCVNYYHISINLYFIINYYHVFWFSY